MCSSGGSSAPQTTPLPKQETGNPANGVTAINNAPAAPTNTTVDQTTTDTQTDRGTSSLRIRRSRGSASTSGGTGTGLNIPT
ncbi:hypothetical protein DNX69_00600 [Rhodopseudomonas palustris]|jgi:hypothetical protein|uniref:Uncharacterized protein n=1 Tax=Rhodopseudomonas palustris TaxID=1076 RepID=A0A323UQK9_RHOPL|nr:hypothetical protein [Rhodopseudomonas palustris]PZA13960.1 hypothetical protein DNX69_00600 [Rhodopseudomonas palustris]